MSVEKSNEIESNVFVHMWVWLGMGLRIPAHCIFSRQMILESLIRLVFGFFLRPASFLSS
jgi:hypothetical protein